MKITSVLWTTVGILGTAGVCKGYAMLQPKVVDASEAQIRAISPAELLVPLRHDPIKEARYKELIALCRQAERVDRADTNDDTWAAHAKQIAYDQAEYTVNRDVLEQIDRLISQGPVQAPREAAPMGGFVESRPVTDTLSDSIKEAIDREDKLQCQKLLAQSWRFAKAWRSSLGVGTYPYWFVRLEGAVVNSTLLAARSGMLSRKAMVDTLAAMPSPHDPDPAFAMQIRAEFQQILPTLKTARVVESELYPDQMPSSYDAIETARFLGFIYDQAYHNALRDWPHQAPILEPNLAARLSHLPELAENNGMAGRSDALSRMRFAAYPNSLGLSLCQSKTYELPGMAKSFATESTRREIARAMVAIKLYQEDHHGLLPPNLETLVQLHYVTTPPRDFFAAKPLHYVPAKKWLESVGPGNVYALNTPPGDNQQTTIGEFLDSPETSSILDVSKYAKPNGSPSGLGPRR